MKKTAIIAALGLQSLAIHAQQTVLTGSGQSFQFNTAQGVFEFQNAGKAVTGRPLSASEERHTLQILGDGTRIEKTDTDKFYRDDQGRTRIEQADGSVSINDPATHKTVRRKATTSSNQDVAKFKEELNDYTVRIIDQELQLQVTKLKAETAARSDVITGTGREEDLGYQPINGVTARGSRTTTTIPAGQIGNDRPIQIVSERWYSSDLQMNVKTVNSDPRFGETTYQLTNILQGAPAPTLFQIPAASK